jgi:HD-GYP domain-containing protein (c-di-GMP phosphodiesterase class II)
VSDLEINYPIHTLDNQQLLPAGGILTEDMLDELIESNKRAFYESCFLLQCGELEKDILHLLSIYPYDVIFAGEDKVSHLLKIMEGVSLVLPVFQTLGYFKKHDFYTYRHILMVFALSTLLAQDMVSGYQEQLREAASGPAHDFGKVCIPLDILKKSQPLTKAELNILMHHSVAGYVLLSYYLKDKQSLSCRVARDHHERRDGSGYPQGINLTDRMIEIVAVSDIYDALISPRPYRPESYDNRTACEEITAMASRGEISEEIVRALIAHNRRENPHYSECTLSDEKRGTPPSVNFYRITEDEEKEGDNVEG